MPRRRRTRRTKRRRVTRRRRLPKLSRRMRFSSTCVGTAMQAAPAGYNSASGPGSRVLITAMGAALSVASTVYSVTFKVADIVPSSLFAYIEMIKLKSYRLIFTPNVNSLVPVVNSSLQPPTNTQNVQPVLTINTSDPSIHNAIFSNVSTAYGIAENFTGRKIHRPFKPFSVRVRMRVPEIYSQLSGAGSMPNAAVYGPGRKSPWVMSSNNDPEQYGCLVVFANMASGSQIIPQYDVAAAIKILIKM